MNVPPALLAMLNRQSVKALVEPGPTEEQFELLVRAATTVPDHGELRPYRFLIVSGEGRGAFGDALAAAIDEARPGLQPGYLEKVRAKAFAAPALIAIVASPRAGKIEEWEQLASAACTGFAIVLAAHTLGLGAIWKSIPLDRSPAFRRHLALADGERLLGWVNLGHAEGGTNAERERTPANSADFAQVVTAQGIVEFARSDSK